MKALAIGDYLLPAKAFDDALSCCELFEEYASVEWRPVEDRSAMREVVRRIETLGSKSYQPSEEILTLSEDVDILFVHLYPVSGDFIERAKHLKCIVTARGGVENIDVAVAKAHGIAIIHCPAHNATAVAEYTVGLIIAEIRNIARSHMGLRSGTWREQFPNSTAIPELVDASVGIIGFGTIGHMVAQRLKGFECRIFIHDPYVAAEEIKNLGYLSAEMDELLKNSDIITLHGRLAAGAPPIIGRAELYRMKPNAYLINTARASLVDMEALYTVLREGRIMGAALDVYQSEPLPDDFPFLGLDNVTLTNHRGGDTLNSYHKAPVLLRQQLAEYLRTGKTRFLIC